MELVRVASRGRRWLPPSEDTYSAPGAVEELVAVATSANCSPCFRYHSGQARELGVSREDVRMALQPRLLWQGKALSGPRDAYIVARKLGLGSEGTGGVAENGN